MPLDRVKNKANARYFGQDLMRGEHVLKKRTTWANGPREKDDTSKTILACGGQGQESSGTSIFDPVLTELCYQWFCPPRGKILDPFAGGSVRGIVAGWLGFDYVGFDLSKRQVMANRKQWQEINATKPAGERRGIVTWLPEDSAKALVDLDGLYDFVFSCPPYGDLEVYSDDPRDLSAMSFDKFSGAYADIIEHAVAKLKPDRFAAFVVGDFRDDKGFYRNFLGVTIDAFEYAGAKLYNEAILVTSVGSLPIRVGKQFGQNRKLGKTHQNLLVFYKGDPKKIRINFPAVEMGDTFGLKGYSMEQEMDRAARAPTEKYVPRIPTKAVQTHRAKARWREMISRCTDPDNKDYPRYGGRGITVDPGWLSYEKFLEDMGPTPPGMTLERKENDLGYSKSNCCWATRKEQTANRRISKRAGAKNGPQATAPSP